MNRAKPAHTDHLGNAEGVAPVGLDRHCLEHALNLAGLHAHRLHPGFAQVAVQPLRQRPGLEADASDGQVQIAQERNQRF